MTGRFIVFEGGDGCGKSTQAGRLAESLGAVLTRQPGGTRIGRTVRSILLNPDEAGLADRAEALLMAADRAQHVHELIGPALERGDDVVCDRYSYSSIAYQGYGRELPVDEIAELSRWATEGLTPDLVILLTVSADVAAARLGDGLDRFERVGDGFHRRVADGYAEMAAGDPDRWVVIPGDGSVDEVAAAVTSEIRRRWGPSS